MARIPARAEERAGHRTKAELEAVAPTKVAAQKLRWHAADKEWHPIPKRWYLSLRRLPVARFYLQSDVETAYLVAELETRLLEMEEPKAALVAQIRQMKNDLMSTEGARRAMHIETGHEEKDDAREKRDKKKLQHYAGLRGNTDE